MSVRLILLLPLLGLLGLPLAPTAALASERPWTLKKQVLLARTIARGRVIAVSDRVVTVTRDHLVKAYQARVKLAEVLKGELKGKELVVHYRRHIGKASAFPEVTIRPGKEYIFYLTRGKRNRLEMISPYFGAVRNYYGLTDDIRAVLKKLPPTKTKKKPVRKPDKPATKPKIKPKAKTRPRINIPAIKAPRPVGGLLAIARVEKATFKAGEPLKLWLVLKNVGQKKIDLYFHALDRFATFEIYRSGPDPAKLRAENPASPDPPRASAYVPLEKEAYVYTSVPLSELVKLKAGRYQARVRVEIPALYAGTKLGKTGWTGTLFSGWVTFEVTGKAPKAAARQSWRVKGHCNTTHLGSLDFGKCGRCGSRSSSKSKQLCVFCADELQVCPFCLKQADD